MRFEAIIEEWDRAVHDDVEKEVVFEDIKGYQLDENFLIVFTNDGTHHAIKAHVVKKFTVTN